MSNLMSTLISSAKALSVLDRALLVSQNNVANASTPGFAAQRLTLQAAEFDTPQGLIGGVRAGDVQSARNLYAEQGVRRQVELLGTSEQEAESLAAIEPNFDVTGDQGIPGALNRLFQSFSAWSLEPNSRTSRQSILDNSRRLTEIFQQTSSNLANASSDTDRQLRQTVDEINQLGAKLEQYNADRRRGGQQDAGLDTKIQNALEQLSELVSCTSAFQADGSVTVLIGGQIPLLIGENLFPVRISFEMPASPPPVYAGAAAPARLFSTEGQDITGLVSQGRLAGLLEVRNQVLPSLGGDAHHAGDLNVLAKSIADRVNGILTSSLVSAGPPPVAGVPLFAYDATNDATVARTITLDPGITTDMLASIAPGPPFSINGAALELANLADPTRDADRIDGFSFVEFYGQMAGRVGKLLADARDNQDYQGQMAAQARNLRSQLSGVSLDEEAVLLIEFQRAYQANARVVTIINELTQDVINMMS